MVVGDVVDTVVVVEDTEEAVGVVEEDTEGDSEGEAVDDTTIIIPTR